MILLLLACRTAEPEIGPVAMVEEVSGVYGSDVRGVCRKYTHCRCNPYGTIDACVAEFGSAGDLPPKVWSCVLARDCEGLCEMDAGACFELYAMEVTRGGAAQATCPPGQHRLELYDVNGKFLRDECR